MPGIMAHVTNFSVRSTEAAMAAAASHKAGSLTSPGGVTCSRQRVTSVHTV